MEDIVFNKVRMRRFVYEPKAMISHSKEYKCAPGFGMGKDFCVPCPLGTHFRNHQCKPCALDTYNPALGAKECYACPDKTETFKEGATSVHDCVERNDEITTIAITAIIGTFIFTLLVIKLIRKYHFKEKSSNKMDITENGSGSLISRAECSSSGTTIYSKTITDDLASSVISEQSLRSSSRDTSHTELVTKLRNNIQEKSLELVPIGDGTTELNKELFKIPSLEVNQEKVISEPLIVLTATLENSEKNIMKNLKTQNDAMNSFYGNSPTISHVTQKELNRISAQSVMVQCDLEPTKIRKPLNLRNVWTNTDLMNTSSNDSTVPSNRTFLSLERGYVKKQVQTLESGREENLINFSSLEPQKTEENIQQIHSQSIMIPPRYPIQPKLSTEVSGREFAKPKIPMFETNIRKPKSIWNGASDSPRRLALEDKTLPHPTGCFDPIHLINNELEKRNTPLMRRILV